MNNQILIICGPTGTGKTSLGIHLAKKFAGEIVSADSRQVYKGMDIGTGKERDLSGEVEIWGYDLVDSKKEFSVSHFVKYANQKISDILSRNKLPIIVGGTGLYIKGVVDGFETVGIPKNDKLRKQLLTKNSGELFDTLSQIDSIKAGSMNYSDKNNTRRLIRAIEIATWLIDNPYQKEKNNFSTFDNLFIGLTSDFSFLDEKINTSVDKRVAKGQIKEIENLIENKVAWEDQSMQALGYRQWRDYFEGDVPMDIVIEEWKKEEKKYVRRQMTWFKKDKRVNWFDIRSENLHQDVENLVKAWHNR